MAEARAKFKEENPDYKSAFKPVRVVKETFPEVTREHELSLAEKFGKGLNQAQMLSKIQEKFPSASIEGELENIPADSPLEIRLNKEDYRAAIEFAKADPALKMDYLIDITAIDYPDRFELVTMLRSLEKGHKVFFCTPLPKAEVAEEKKATSLLASIPSISDLYATADLKEREVYDMFGIKFEGHQDLRRIFLDPQFEGYPLRKDFTNPNMMKRPV
ncbi:NADH-quinone oxidoreductase subunit C [Fibrobacter sp. UWR4]|uniref:NADH-quinone oxidoreductase subunit C n=1 Tax=unclassified Fibrobacter TaxID=2634177 RepID=UPI0035117DEE